MGKIFLDHIGGTRLFSCKECDVNLTNRSELISTRFTGATGRAFLFHKVVNLVYSEIQDRVMLTGRHMVRDVSCKNCGTKLGWVYEYATEDNQSLNRDDRVIEYILNKNNLDFSGDDDDEEYLPPDVLRAFQESEEAENCGEGEDEETREEARQDNENTEELSQSISRSLWRKNVMPCRGSDIADDVLISQGSADMNVLYCFFGARLLGITSRTEKHVFSSKKESKINRYKGY